jgi:uncharacterized phage-like protein YoqJ
LVPKTGIRVIFIILACRLRSKTKPFVTNTHHTLCFSGHRRYTPSPADGARLSAALESAWADGYRVFVSGMAPGFDLAAAEAVVALGLVRRGVKLIAAIPFSGQASGYTAADKSRYEALLKLADEVRVLEERYSHGCYYRRDEWMVERSGRLVCWYDGSSGGTRYTVRRALKAGLEIVNTFRATDSLF